MRDKQHTTLRSNAPLLLRLSVHEGDEPHLLAVTPTLAGRGRTLLVAARAGAVETNGDWGRSAGRNSAERRSGSTEERHVDVYGKEVYRCRCGCE